MAVKLKPQHRMLADFILKNPKASQREAALHAGYSAPSADSTATEILSRPDVVAYLAERTGKALVKVDASVDRIVQELAALGFSDIRQIMTADGKGFLPVHEWPREIAVCIASIEVETKDVEADAHEGEERAAVTLTTRVTKVKLWPKVQALALLAQYRKMVGAGDSIPSDLRQQFVGLAVTVAPGATANIQVIAPPGAKGEV